MKKIYNRPLMAVILLLKIFYPQTDKAQCALTYYAGIGVANSGTAFATWSNFGPGQYFAMPVLSGGSYAISTCGASINTELTGWDGSASSVVLYNDNNGPVCTGNAASVDNYIPNFTNYMYVQVTQASCQAGGSASINLYLRQNDNLVFTLPSTTLCTGQTMNLSATPAPVGSTPGGYGSPGQFSGTGVAGTTFTAPVVSSATTYTLTYTFGYVSKTATLSVIPNPTMAVTVSNPSVCQGSSVSITATGATSYTLSGGIGNGVSFTPAATTAYTVQGGNSCGVTSSMVTITVNPLPAVALNSGSVCIGRSFTLVPSGANTYTFSSGSAIVAPASTSSYSVTGTNTLTGCTNSAVTTITVNSLPVVALNSGSICAGNSFTLNPSGANTYTFSSGSAIVAPASTSSYSVTGTNTLNGCTNSAVTTITVNSLPVVALNSGSICAGSSFTLNPSGANTYTFSSGSTVVTPASTSSYSVTGTNTLTGCSNTAITTITVNSLPVVALNSGSICVGNSFTLVPSGANTYTFSSGSAIVAPASTSSYSVTGTNTLTGCSNTAITTVSVDPLPSIAIMSSDSLICSGESATLTPTGGVNYVWNGGANVSQIVITPTANTTYTVTGNDSHGCSNTAMFTETVTLCLGIAHFSETESLVQVYPNPNHGEFVISVQTAGTHVFIYNETGQLVKDLPPGTTNEAINITALANGVYFVRAVNGDTMHQKKVIVAH